MTDDKRELEDLPELPDLAELQDLPELSEIEDLPELPDEVAPASGRPRSVQRELPLDEMGPLDDRPELDPLDQKVDQLDELPDLPDEPEEDLEPLEEIETVPDTVRAKRAWDPVAEPAAASVPEAKAPARPEPKPPVAPRAKPIVKPAAESPAPKETAPEPVTPPAAAASPEPVAAAKEAPAPVPEAPAASALPPGEKPPLRELDKALVHLRLASKIVVFGALVPFMKPTNEATLTDGIAITLGSKVIIILAAWIWMQQVLENWEPKLKGFLKSLAGFKLQLGFLKKDKEEDPKKAKRRVQKQASVALEHPFPTGLHLLSMVLIVVSIALAVQDPRQGVAGPLALAEMGMLGWAAFTIVHVASYERWGSFSPLFPLMFLGMLFSGLAGAAAGLGAEGGQKIASLVGGALVAAGGGLAAYTIVESMLHAKKEGDRKKAEALEARKAARKARRAEK